ncbi:dentin sialophosphoprotein-like [Dorcoceras hygrometricum]|uniref:Dentin sialophosphoprotein-like n=1 Tax=Dorcoceras hygrometricum TaxID=472368 RepID=A0A2Z7ASM3_9LAMI|nr:dentin sialophosphoprotein-like [Dorcoceras hygrometricum]
MKCMRAIKDRIARPVYQLANHLSRASIQRMINQPGKSSVRDIPARQPSQLGGIPKRQVKAHHSDDSVGLFRHTTSVAQSQRGSQSAVAHQNQQTSKQYVSYNRHQPLLTTDISSSSQRNQQQPSDVAFSKEHQNDAASTNQNNTASLQQLTTDSLRNHIFGLTHRIMVKRLATSPHDPLGINDSAYKNQSVMFSVQYGPFNSNIPIRSMTIGKSRVARDPITMHTSWRSNSDIACVTSIGYPRTRASGESSTTKHRILHASGPHPTPPTDGPNLVGKRVKVRHLSCRVSMMFQVMRANLYNQDLTLNPIDKW